MDWKACALWVDEIQVGRRLFNDRTLLTAHVFPVLPGLARSRRMPSSRSQAEATLR